MSLLRVALLVLGISLSPTVALAASIEEEVKAAYAAWDAAFNKSDAKAVAAFYSADATFLPATHDVIEGPAGVEKFFAGIFAAGVTEHKLEIIKASGGDKLIVAAAKWSAKAKDASGAPTSVGGIATHAFEKQADGTLKLKLHTFN